MNRISELRKKYGISQKDLAKELHIAQNTLSQYENELRNPSVQISTRMAEFFEVPVSYLLGAPEENHESSNTSETLDFFNVTKVTQTDHAGHANILISFGWKLLHVGEARSVNYDGSGYSDTVFTLGWYGDPSKAILPHFEADGEEYEEMYLRNTPLDE